MTDRCETDVHDAWNRRDTAAAALAAGSSPATCERLIRLVRGRPAHRESSVEQRGGRGAPLPPGPELVAVLGRLTAGAASVTFVHVGPDALAWSSIRFDPVGVPTIVHTQQVTWLSMVGPAIADRDLLAFHLAGGVGTEARMTPFDLYQRLATQLPRLDSVEPGSAVVISQPDPRWEVPMELAEELARRHRTVWGPSAVEADPEAEAARLLRFAPLGHEYSLVAVAPTDGGLWPTSKVLFPAGTMLPASGSVEIVVPGDVERSVCLPVVVADGTDPKSWTPVAVLVAKLPAGRQSVRLTLASHGRPTLDGRPSSPGTKRWGDLLELIPHPTSRSSLDVVIALESCDADETGRQRLDILAESLGLLSSASGVRVALLAYGQHRATRGFERDVTVRKVDFTTPARLLADVASVSDRLLEANHNDMFAAAEEMVEIAASLLSASGASQRALVTIGRRAPYPAGPHNWSGPSCPSGRRWESPAQQLVREGATLVAIRQPQPWLDLLSTERELGRHWESFWSSLGAHATIPAAGFRGDSLARALNLEHAVAPHELPFVFAVD